MSDLGALESALRDMLGPGFGIGACDPRLEYGGLWSAEETATTRMVPKRRLEFTAGRFAARAAMADLNLPAAAIPMGPERAPIWPDGLIGSIAHCTTACIAAVAPKDHAASIGLDIEEATPLAPELWETVLTPGERDWLADQNPNDQGLLAKQIFCAKEAFYKAQFPVTGKMLTFLDVKISLGLETFSVTSEDKEAKGQIRILDGLIVAMLVFAEILTEPGIIVLES